MCNNKYWISNIRQRKILVKCGKCPSCLQEKAIGRANRIRANMPDDGSVMALFVTLTYSNLFVPYFDYEEFKTSPFVVPTHGNPLSSSKGGYKRLHVYRNASVRYVRTGSSYKTYAKIIKNRHTVTTVLVPYENCYLPLNADTNKNIVTCLENGVPVEKVKFDDDFRFDFGTQFVPAPQFLRRNKRPLRKPYVGVSYYPDVQNFIKRLRLNLKRLFNYEDYFSFYSCAEYGETYARPHFHLLLFVKRRTSFAQSQDFLMWQSAITKSWPYCDNHILAKSVEIARNAASYVSSYVNCLTSLPPLLRDTPGLRPKHSYSKGFGLALKSFTFAKVQELYRNRDLHLDVPRIKNKSLVIDHILLPKYVLSRFFPKFKGYCNLTSDEIESICARPASIRNYAHRLDLTPEQCHAIEVCIKNKKVLARSQGIDSFYFGEMYANIWTIYASNVLKDFYENINDIKQYFTAYDNIKDLLECRVCSPSLEEAGEHLPPNFHFFTDPNTFPLNVQKTLHLTSIFHKYRKDRRIRNYTILQSTQNFNI